MQRKNYRVAFGILLILIITSCSHYKKIPDADANNLTIVAITDFHGALSKAEALASALRELQAKYKDRMLLIDGGDLFQGSLEDSLSKGRATIEFYNLLRVDAAAIGNHDLDYGPDVPQRVTVKPHEDGLGNLKARAQDAKFQWLSANFIDAQTKKPIFKPYVILKRAQKKICILGATTPITQFITSPGFIKGTKFLPLKETVLRESQYLRHNQHCQYVILTVHAGLDCNRDTHRCLEDSASAEVLPLLKELPPHTVDAVIAGHTHQLAQEEINGTPIIEAGFGAHNVGILHLRGTYPQLTHEFEPFISIKDQVTDPSLTTDVTQVLAPYRNSAKTLKEKIIGSAQDFFANDYTKETALGNFIAHAVHQMSKAQFVLLNAGGIRSSLSQGPITYGNIFQILPFNNNLTTVTLRGSEFKRLVAFAFNGAHGIPPISGFKVWLKKTNSKQNEFMKILDEKGRAIEDKKFYSLATIDFLVQGGDHQKTFYDTIPQSRIHFHEGTLIRDMTVQYIKQNPKMQSLDFLKSDQEHVTWITPQN